MDRGRSTDFSGKNGAKQAATDAPRPAKAEGGTTYFVGTTNSNKVPKSTVYRPARNSGGASKGGSVYFGPTAAPKRESSTSSTSSLDAPLSPNRKTQNSTPASTTSAHPTVNTPTPVGVVPQSVSTSIDKPMTLPAPALESIQKTDPAIRAVTIPTSGSTLPSVAAQPTTVPTVVAVATTATAPAPAAAVTPVVVPAPAVVVTPAATPTPTAAAIPVTPPAPSIIVPTPTAVLPQAESVFVDPAVVASKKHPTEPVKPSDMSSLLNRLKECSNATKPSIIPQPTSVSPKLPIPSPVPTSTSPEKPSPVATPAFIDPAVASAVVKQHTSDPVPSTRNLLSKHVPDRPHHESSPAAPRKNDSISSPRSNRAKKHILYTLEELRALRDSALSAVISPALKANIEVVEQMLDASRLVKPPKPKHSTTSHTNNTTNHGHNTNTQHNGNSNSQRHDQQEEDEIPDWARDDAPIGADFEFRYDDEPIASVSANTSAETATALNHHPPTSVVTPSTTTAVAPADITATGPSTISVSLPTASVSLTTLFPSNASVALASEAIALPTSTSNGNASVNLSSVPTTVDNETRKSDVDSFFQAFNVRPIAESIDSSFAGPSSLLSVKHAPPGLNRGNPLLQATPNFGAHPLTSFDVQQQHQPFQPAQSQLTTSQLAPSAGQPSLSQSLTQSLLSQSFSRQPQQSQPLTLQSSQLQPPQSFQSQGSQLFSQQTSSTLAPGERTAISNMVLPQANSLSMGITAQDHQRQQILHQQQLIQQQLLQPQQPEVHQHLMQQLQYLQRLQQPRMMAPSQPPMLGQSPYFNLQPQSQYTQEQLLYGQYTLQQQQQQTAQQIQATHQQLLLLAQQQKQLGMFRQPEFQSMYVGQNQAQPFLPSPQSSTPAAATSFQDSSALSSAEPALLDQQLTATGQFPDAANEQKPSLPTVRHNFGGKAFHPTSVIMKSSKKPKNP